MSAVLDSYADKVEHVDETWWWVKVSRFGQPAAPVLVAAPHPGGAAEKVVGDPLRVRMVTEADKAEMFEEALRKVAERVMANPDTDPRSVPEGGGS